MLKLNLREIAKELDIAIECFDKALDILSHYNSKDCILTSEDRKKIRELSRRCIRLESLRDETGTMAIERAIHICDRKKAVEIITKAKEDFKDARSLINV